MPEITGGKYYNTRTKAKEEIHENIEKVEKCT
jgi:hypothetical protein